MVDFNAELSGKARERLMKFGAVVALGGSALVGAAAYASFTYESSVEVYQKSYTDRQHCLSGTDFDVHHASPITRFVDGNEILTIIPDETQNHEPRMLNFLVDHEGVFKTKAILHPSDQITESFLTSKC